MNIVAHNLQAMYSNRQLGIVTGKKDKSSEKLSSGYRINRAADDAAGLSMSEKMRRQIRGLTQGTKNVQDGISMCQIADGALEEVSDMMHRLTELSVKSANGTCDTEDRLAIQREVNAILQEIDRVSESTTFNEIPIFKIGPEESESYSKWDASDDEIRRRLIEGDYPRVSGDVSLHDVDEALSADDANVFLSELSGWMYWDEVHKYSWRSESEIQMLESIFWKEHDKMYNLGKEAWLQDNPGGDWERSFANSIWISADDMAKQGFFYRDRSKFYKDHTPSRDHAFGRYSAMNDPSINSHVQKYTNSGWLADLSLWMANGKHVFSIRGLISDIAAFGSNNGELAEMCDTMDYDHYTGDMADARKQAYDIYRYIFKNETENEDTQKKDGIWIQSGTESGDGMSLKFRRMNSNVLGVHDLDVSSQTGAQSAISRVKGGLEKLSTIRSEIGAQQNRLEHTIKHQENTIENTQRAESLIRDTDMADEMMKFSATNVLQQAGQAMLTQANQSNRGVLTLLQ